MIGRGCLLVNCSVGVCQLSKMFVFVFLAEEKPPEEPWDPYIPDEPSQILFCHHSVEEGKFWVSVVRREHLLLSMVCREHSLLSVVVIIISVT